MPVKITLPLSVLHSVLNHPAKRVVSCKADSKVAKPVVGKAILFTGPDGVSHVAVAKCVKTKELDGVFYAFFDEPVRT